MNAPSCLYTTPAVKAKTLTHDGRYTQKNEEPDVRTFSSRQELTIRCCACPKITTGQDERTKFWTHPRGANPCYSRDGTAIAKFQTRDTSSAAWPPTTSSLSQLRQARTINMCRVQHHVQRCHTREERERERERKGGGGCSCMNCRNK